MHDDDLNDDSEDEDSIEQQHHPASRYRAGNGALFSASKCPPGPGLHNSCELPFGFLWTPLSPTDDTTTLQVMDCAGTALPAILCITCLAYMSLYASFDAETGIWECPLCGAENVAPLEAFAPNGSLRQVLSCPGVEFRQTLVESSSSSSKEPDTCSIVMVLDENLPRAEAQTVGSAIQCILSNIIHRDQGIQYQLGLVIFGQNIRIYQLGAESGIASADLFETHEAVTDKHLATRSYMATVGMNDTLSCLMRCLYAVYGVALDADETSTGDNVTEHKTLSRKDLLKQRKEARLRKEQNTESQMPKSPWTLAKEQARSPLRSTGEAIQVAIDLATADPNKASRTARILLFTNGCPNYRDGSVVASAESSAATNRNQVDPVKLANAVDYFSILAKAASEVGVGMDVFCSGSSELASPSFQALVEPSSGYVMPHTTFATEHLRRNMEFVLEQTFVAGLHFPVPDVQGSSVPLRDKNWVDGCILDLRFPSFITPTHIVGPGVVDDGPKQLIANERSAFAIGASLAAGKGMTTNNLPFDDIVDASMTRIRLGRFDPIATFSVMLQVNQFYQQESHALFQCIARHVDRKGKVLVTRVFTHRMPFAKDIGEFVDVVDEEVVPVLLGKEAVYRAMYGKEARNVKTKDTPDFLQLEGLAEEAQRDVDATIQKISVAYRLLGLQEGSSRRGVDLTEEGGIRASGSSLDFAFPPELADTLRRLYHMRRGPLLFPGPMQSMDGRAEIRSLFIRLPLEDCLGMMALSCWSTGALTGQANMHTSTVPPETLALWDNTILAGDHYLNLFVWSGQATSDPVYDKVRERYKKFLLKRSRHRFPMPTLYVLSEGDSMSRRFTALLAPSHDDPVEQQLAHFPSLGNLSPTELSDLQKKFKFYDSSTDSSFRKWFWSVSSSCAAKDDGISLCA